MRLETADGRELWLTYCMNVHSGGDVGTQQAALESTVVPLRERLGVAGPFGVGLRFDAAGVRALHRNRTSFADTLRRHRLVPFTANGFVMGRFHGEPLKDAVYAPSWASRERVDYTLALAEVMADLVRSTASIREVSISTSPLAWRGWGGEGRERIEGAAHLAEVARALRALAANTGIVVRLGLEPEPGCVLDRTVDAAAFLGGPVRERLDGDESAFRHLGVCYDVCHQAVMHEDVRDGLDLLEAEGIPVVKAQATCAIEAPDPRDAEARRALTAFDEPVYLHQVGAKRASGDVLLVEELGDALRDDAPIRALAPWRIHFHVPVFRRALVGGLRSTRPHLDALLALVAERDVTRHIEIETYTFDVIPGIEKQGGSGFDLVDALEREYRTVLDVLSRHGVRATDEEASA